MTRVCGYSLRRYTSEKIELAFNVAIAFQEDEQAREALVNGKKLLVNVWEQFLERELPDE